MQTLWSIQKRLHEFCNLQHLKNHFTDPKLLHALAGAEWDVDWTSTLALTVVP
jgi:hypothetical protein